MIVELAVILLVSWLFWLAWDYLIYQGRPPGPMRFPILGNLVQLALVDSKSHVALDKLAKQYGDLMTFKMGFVDVVLISSHKAYVELYCRNETLDRPTEGALKDRIMSKNLGLGWCNGENWEKMRKFAYRSLHKSGFGNRNLMEHFIHEELEHLTAFLKTQMQNSRGLVHFDNFFSVSVTNLMMGMIIGKRFSYDNADLLGVLDSSAKFMKAGVFGVGVMTAYPFLRFVFPNALGYNLQMESMNEIYNFARKLLEKQRKTKPTHNSTPQCFIEEFSQKIEEEANVPNTIFTDEQFFVAFADLLQAGSDTTGNYLSYAILLLATHQEVQEKFYQEICMVIGKTVSPSATDCLRMHYTRAVILEIHRFAKVLISGVPRRVTHDFTYENYKIKKGTMLMTNLYGMLEDRSFFGDPENFRPERFLNQNGEIISGIAERVMPYGAGKRSCFGESLSIDTIFLYLTILVQTFSFEIPSGQDRPSLEPLIGFTTSPYPFDALVQCRK